MTENVLSLSSPSAVEAARGEASVRRGLNLAVGAQAEARFAASVGDSGAGAKPTGRIAVGGRAVVRASLPVDLWGAAGLVAEAALGCGLSRRSERKAN